MLAGCMTRIKAACDAKGIKSWSELERISGVSHVTLRNWDKGRCLPHSRTMDDLCYVLDITPDYLLNGDAYKETAEARLRNIKETLMNMAVQIYEIIAEVRKNGK